MSIPLKYIVTSLVIASGLMAQADPLPLPEQREVTYRERGGPKNTREARIEHAQQKLREAEVKAALAQLERTTAESLFAQKMAERHPATR